MRQPENVKKIYTTLCTKLKIEQRNYKCYNGIISCITMHFPGFSLKFNLFSNLFMRYGVPILTESLSPN